MNYNEDRKKALYMIGTEIEKTPAFSKKTLFVAGYRPHDEISNVAKQHKVMHIYMGANRSFRMNNDWDLLLTKLLDSGFIVTLDYPVEHHKDLTQALSKGIWQCRNFIPLATVNVTKLNILSQNLTIKIDDPDAVNEGVWCWNQHELVDSNKFTGWNEYEDDEIIKAPVPPLPVSRVPAAQPVQRSAERMKQQVQEIKIPDNPSKEDLASLYSGEENTTSVSIDSSDANNEPELVAQKTVRIAKTKSKNQKLKDEI